MSVIFAPAGRKELKCLLLARGGRDTRQRLPRQWRIERREARIALQRAGQPIARGHAIALRLRNHASMVEHQWVVRAEPQRLVGVAARLGDLPSLEQRPCQCVGGLDAWPVFAGREPQEQTYNYAWREWFNATCG